MLHLALSKSDYEAYLRALTGSHQIRVDARIHDANEKEISSLTAPTSRVVSGAVQVDATAAVTRSLSMTLIDPNRTLQFEANSPAGGAIYADRFISVRYEVRVQELFAWVTVPVFWGPISAYERAGGEVTIEAQGKESLMLAPHYATQGYTIPIRYRLDDAIRDVARRAGEGKFDLPDLSQKLARAHVVHPQAEPWQILNGGQRVKGLQRKGKQSHNFGKRDDPPELHPSPGLVSHGSGDRRAYFNGQGSLTVRKLDRPTSFTFHEGVHLTEAPQVSYDLSAFRNHVVVKGGKPKGKPSAHGEATLPATHSLSPASLARNGVPRYLTEFVEAEGLKTDANCRERAGHILQRRSREGVEAQFSSLPIPHLEEDDQVGLRTEDGFIAFPLRQFTIPLTAQESMSVNWLKQVRTGKKRRHNRPRVHAPGPR